MSFFTQPILPLVLVAFIAFYIAMYVILDGFTLGTGILLPFLTESERDIAKSMILPTWDGNQTWIVLGGASLYGAFPLAFSILLPILYMPILILVLALLFRGVAFEFRLKTKRARPFWDSVFFMSSLLATFIQGLIIGNVVQGFQLDRLPPAIPEHSLITVFSIFTGFCMIFGYTLLGSTRMILKTEAKLQQKMFKIARVNVVFVILIIAAISLYTPFVYPGIKALWFNLKYWPFLAWLPMISGALFLAILWGIHKQSDYIPYWCSVALVFTPFVGFGISLFPYIVPYKLTIWQAASPTGSLKFMLVAIIIMLPVLLFYTWYSYHVFKGKVREVLEY